MSFATPSESLYVEGLPLDATNEALVAVFAQYGTVRQCQVLDPAPGQADRAALLTMGSAAEASWLVEHVNQNIPVGLLAPITVQYSVSVPLHEASMPGALHGTAAAGAASPPLAAAGLALGLQGAAAGGTPLLPGGLPAGVLLSGVVKRWDTSKGFGFIVPDGGGPDVFVHARELTDGEVLVNGTHVMFEAMLDPAKGPGRYRAKTCLGAQKKDALAASLGASERLFVVGLPAEITEEHIKAIFGQYGAVASVKKLPSQAGKNDAAALVKMGDVNAAKWLVDNVSRNIPTGLTTPVIISFAENKVPGHVPPPVVVASPAAVLLATAAGAYGKALGLQPPVVPGAQSPYGAAAAVRAAPPVSGGWVPQL